MSVKYSMEFIRLKNLVFPLIVIFLASCATGSAIVTGTERTPIDPTLVNLYLETPPENYEVIGLVNASSDAGWTDQESMDYAIQELKNQAAKIGANGVLIASTGETTPVVSGYNYGTGYFWAVPVTAKTVEGRAIFVSE